MDATTRILIWAVGLAFSLGDTTILGADHTLAFGHFAYAVHEYSTVMSGDGSGASSTTTKQFTAVYDNGYRLLGGDLEVVGSAKAATFIFPLGDYLTGDGTNLSYVTADGATTNALTTN